jgi:hypothetical protein
MSETNSHLLPLQEKWIMLSAQFIRGLFIYYSILFLASMIVAGFRLSYFMSLSDNSDNTISFSQIIIQSFICGILGSSIYYYRKLYKSCIQKLVTSESNSTIASLGVKAYFVGRPVIGAVISVIAILIVYGGLFFLVDDPKIALDKFYIFISILSFLFGFSNGSLIVKLEKSKDRIAESVDFSKGGK